MDLWTDSLIENWYIEPGNEEAKDRVVRFDRELHSLVYSPGHILLHEPFSEEDFCERREVDPSEKLRSWMVPRVQSLLQLDVEKDLHPVLDLERIEFMREIRNTFLLYVRARIGNVYFYVRDALTLCEFIHGFKVLFDHKQYGLGGLWRAVIKKLIVWVKNGAVEFLLFLFDWIPHMITKEHRPLCEFDVSEFESRVISRNMPVLVTLYQKHQHKLSLYGSRT